MLFKTYKSGLHLRITILTDWRLKEKNKNFYFPGNKIQKHNFHEKYIQQIFSTAK